MRKLVEWLAEWLYEHWVNLVMGFVVLIVLLAAAGGKSIEKSYAEAGWQKVNTHSFVDSNGDSVLMKYSGGYTKIYVKKNTGGI